MANINNIYFEGDGSISFGIPMTGFEFQLWYGYVPKLKINTEEGMTNVIL